MTLNSIKWIFFDLDGTLIKSTESLFHVYLDFLSERGKIGNKEEFELLNGPSLDEIVDFLKNQYDLPETNVELRVEYLRKIQAAYEKLSIPKYVRRSLQEIIAHGYKIALVTSASKHVAESLVMKIGKSFFSYVIYGDILRHSKPDPEIYELAYKQSGVSKDAIIVFEDSVNGYLSATRAGLRCIMVHGGVKLKSIWYFLEEGQRCGVIMAKNLAIRCNESPLSVIEVQKKNNFILDVKRLISVKETIVIEGSFVAYDKFKEERSSGIDSANKITPIGVSGLVVLRQKKKERYVLFATRSAMVTQYPSFLELVPSGGIDTSSLCADSLIDYRAKLIAELIEETGFADNSAIDIRNLCLIFDPVEAVYDVCCTIEVEIAPKSLLANFDKSLEYIAPQLVRVDSLSEFIKERKSRLVPTSIMLANCYLYERNAN